jgi:PhnB protein
MAIQPYLFFNGRAEEAAGFYQKTLGAKLEMLMRFKENPDAGKTGAEGCASGGAPDPDSVMHMCLKIGDTAIMGSDGMSKDGPKFEGFSLSYAARNEAEAHRIFKALGEGGQVQMPMGKTFFSPAFGMVADRFGLSWMVIVEQANVAAQAAE